MKAIIIEEERFTEVLDLLKLHVMKLKEQSHVPERLDISQQAWGAAIDEVHRTMHYHFVRWAQGHGASCTK